MSQATTNDLKLNRIMYPAVLDVFLTQALCKCNTGQIFSSVQVRYRECKTRCFNIALSEKQVVFPEVSVCSLGKYKFTKAVFDH